jgi:hypothetical protein
MMLTMPPRRLLLIALLAAATWATTGTARADTATISVTSAVGDRTTATFSVTKTVCETTSYCGWFAYATQQPASRPCTNATGHVWVGDLTEGLVTVTGTEDFFAFADEGPHRLCVYVYANSADTLVAEAVYGQNGTAPPAPTPVPPAPTVTPVAPAPPATVNTAAIPRGLGRQDTSYETLALFPGGAPAGVAPDRFVALVRGVARRWDITTGGVSSGALRFARPDGRNGIGFANLDDGTLGQTNTWSAKVYRRKRSCRFTSAGRRCRIIRRYVGRRIVERDTAFDKSVNWQQGPAYPDGSQFDLETTMIHELGHWARNGHVRDCKASPMIPALDAGDWWRDPTDFHFGHCEVKALAATATAAPGHGGRIRTIDVALPAGVPEPAAAAYAATRWAHAATGRARP